jgi:tRNA(fMet)-specific endonuclease VapC
MKRFILDTGVAADYIFRRADVQSRIESALLAGIRVGVAMPAVGELFAGAENSQTRDRNLRILERTIRELVLWPYDRQAAEEFGRIFAILKRIGRPMQQIDIQIAAIAISLGSSTIITYDTDFVAIPGLKLEAWPRT